MAFSKFNKIILELLFELHPDNATKIPNYSKMPRVVKRKFLLDFGVDSSEQPTFIPVFSLEGTLKNVFKNGFTRNVLEDKRYPVGNLFMLKILKFRCVNNTN